MTLQLIQGHIEQSRNMKIKVNLPNLKNHQLLVKIKELACEFLQSKKYQQIEVPVLSPVLIPESYLEIFETEFNYFDKKNKLYLTPSPELFLKRLIVKDLGSCFSMVKAFRNSEPTTSRHFSEFTILEYYKVNADYMDVARDTLGMMQYFAQKLYGKKEINYQGKKIALDSWEKISVTQAFEKYAGIKNVIDKEALFEQAKKKKYQVDDFTYSDIWSQIYTQEVEPNLGTNGRPTIIYDYPEDLAAITYFNKERQVAERWEFYIEGIELGNCGNESIGENDVYDWKGRLEKEQKLRQENGKLMFKPDMEFADVLNNLPKCSGIAIGLERLAMIFADVKSIQDLQMIVID